MGEEKGLIAARGDDGIVGEFTAERTWGIDDHVEIQYGAPSMLGAYQGFVAPAPAAVPDLAPPTMPPSVASTGGYGGGLDASAGARKAPPPLSEAIPDPPVYAPQVGPDAGPAPPPCYTPKVGDGAPPPPCWTPKV